MKGKVLDLTYRISDVDCYVCKLHKRGAIKMEFIGNLYTCPLCESGVISQDPFAGIDGTILKAHNNAIMNNDILDYASLNPHLYNSYFSLLLDEARECIMFGHYLSGILTLNNYVESIAKEIIFLNEGERFEGPLGKTINHLEKKEYVSQKDIDRLKRIKDDIRNPYTHGNAAELLKDVYVPMRNIEDLKSNMMGESRYINMSDMPNAAFVSLYNSVIKEQAIYIFNAVAELARDFASDYLSKPAKLSETRNAFEKGLTKDEMVNMKKEGKEFKVVDRGEKTIITSPDIFYKSIR